MTPPPHTSFSGGAFFCHESAPLFFFFFFFKFQKLKSLIEGVGARSDPESPSFFLGIVFGGQILTKYTGFEQKLTNPLNQTMILVSAPFDLCHRGSQGSVGAQRDPESPSFFLGKVFGGQILTKYTGFEQK